MRQAIEFCLAAGCGRIWAGHELALEDDVAVEVVDGIEVVVRRRCGHAAVVSQVLLKLPQNCRANVLNKHQPSLLHPRFQAVEPALELRQVIVASPERLDVFHKAVDDRAHACSLRLAFLVRVVPALEELLTLLTGHKPCKRKIRLASALRVALVAASATPFAAGRRWRLDLPIHLPIRAAGG